jgi:hypothetical protein
MPSAITLTASQRERLETFLQEREHTGSVVLRPARNLGGDNIEVVLLDVDGEEATSKRILFG